jgi:H+/Cl- antiporter ClcA
LALIGLTHLFSEQYLGLGIEVIEQGLQGIRILPTAWALKMVFVTITLNFCGSGGIITPILFIGATLGNVLGQMWGEHLQFFTAIGMVSLLAGAANTPLTATMLAIELFGDGITLYAMVTCLTSFLMAGHRTVYPSQVLLSSKSAFLTLETNKEICAIDSMHVSWQFPGIFSLLAAWFQKKNVKK